MLSPYSIGSLLWAKGRDTNVQETERKDQVVATIYEWQWMSLDETVEKRSNDNLSPKDAEMCRET